MTTIILSVFVIFNNHSKTDFKSYHGSLWADAGGYYYYLPATFNYGFNAENWPENAGPKVGNGFKEKDGNMVSKYFIGSAVLNVPSYIMAEAISDDKSGEVNGFNKTHQYAVLFSTLFYVMMGLYLLERTWLNYLKKKVLYFLIPILYLSTNLLYYTLDKGGMTHGQSFFLFSLAWYSLDKFIRLNQKKWFLIFCFSTSLAILVRPTAAMVIPFFYLVLSNHTLPVRDNVNFWLKRYHLVLIHLVMIVLIFLPQLFYWNFAFGSYFNYAYGDEGFNFLNPHIIEVLVSPNNGLLLYVPLLLLAIWACFKTGKTGLNTLLFFILILYVFSSWDAWTYGCSLGQRSFIEYYPILLFPLLLKLDQINIWQIKKRLYPLISLIVLLIIIQFKYVYAFDDCYFGETWDYEAWLQILRK